MSVYVAYQMLAGFLVVAVVMVVYGVSKLIYTIIDW
jgi:hypothetical protein